LASRLILAQKERWTACEDRLKDLRREQDGRKSIQLITTYNGRCALWGLPEPLLLDAAHKDERLGQPVVPNGIPLSKIHHAAFDAHLIGIDPDYRLHVSERLLGQNDGPMLEALKRLNGETIHLPSRMKDRPDRDRLALRFERFKVA
jgi:putative restriction endonuclease